jgi:uncharacterized membrane protein
MWVFILTLAVLVLWIYQIVLSRRWKGDVSRLEDALRLLESKLVAPPPHVGHTVAAPVAAAEIVAPPPAEPVPVEKLKPSAAPAPASTYASQLDHIIGEGFRDEPVDVEPARIEVASQGWEAALGGDWLNKIGVLVLVIGLVLFIGYSFSMLGPAGRVAVAAGVSALMLIGGAVIERREKYRVAARGLLGGGWAALYATTYAAHALEAARVISSPTLATVLLAAVALAMILHSLRYRSQVVTGVAYFVAFITLAITQLNFFAVVALAPLAVSLVYLSHRFRWTAMVEAGIPATFGIYMLHASQSQGGSLAAGQTVLFVYWLVFEAFDVLASRRRDDVARASAVFPFNAICFTAVSVIQWAAVSNHTLYQFFLMAAGAYLLSSLVRAVIVPPVASAEELTALYRAKSGGYEGAITLAATFAAVAIALKLSGLSMAIALMTEAELLFLAGHRLRQRFLRRLGSAVFIVANARLVAFDVPQGTHVTIAGSQWYAWSPVALLEAAVFYLNRFVSRRGSLYSGLAAGLVLLVLWFEAPSAYVGLSCLLLAVALHEISIWKRLRDFAIQSYFVGALGLFSLIYRNVFGAALHTDWHGWLPRLACAAVLYAVATRVGFVRDGRENLPEREVVRYVVSTFGSLMAATFLLGVIPSEFAGFSWLLLAVVLYEFGLATRRREFVAQGYLAGAASLVLLVAKNVVLTGLQTDWHGWLPQLASAVVLYALAIRAEMFGAGIGSLRERELLRDTASLAATVLTGAFLANTLPVSLVVVGWAALGLALLGIGTRLGYTALRAQSYILGVIVFGRTWAVNLNLTDLVAGVPVGVLTAVAVIASFYSAELLSPRPQPVGPSADPFQKAEVKARFFFSFMATALLTVLLFQQVSGRMLTVAWGVEGLGLLFAGFPLRERSMRFAGLILLLVCVLKLFVWDLRNLEMPFRVLSFIVLGVILIGVSFFYSRFREQISKYL